MWDPCWHRRSSLVFSNMWLTVAMWCYRNTFIYIYIYIGACHFFGGEKGGIGGFVEVSLLDKSTKAVSEFYLRGRNKSIIIWYSLLSKWYDIPCKTNSVNASNTTLLTIYNVNYDNTTLDRKICDTIMMVVLCFWCSEKNISYHAYRVADLVFHSTSLHWRDWDCQICPPIRQ